MTNDEYFFPSTGTAQGNRYYAPAGSMLIITSNSVDLRQRVRECDYCGLKFIPDKRRNCSNCGAPQKQELE